MRTVSLPRGRHSLHTMPTSTGYEIRTDASYDWDGRKRGQTPFTVLQHTIAGAGNLRYENRNYRVREGETLLVLVPHNHRYWLEQNGRWEFFWISMNGEEALRIHKAILSDDRADPQPEAGDDRASGRLQPAADPGRRRSRRAARRPIAYEAAMALYDDVFGSHPVFSQEYRAMQHVIDHIMANLDRPLPRRGARRCLRPQPGAFFARLCRQRRHAAGGIRAAQAAAAGNQAPDQGAILPVKEVAIMSGFEDPNYFAKVFRRYFGASPTEFRTTGMYSSMGNHR